MDELYILFNELNQLKYCTDAEKLTWLANLDERLEVIENSLHENCYSEESNSESYDNGVEVGGRQSKHTIELLEDKVQDLESDVKRLEKCLTSKNIVFRKFRTREELTKFKTIPGGL
jgi:hypothetical protein